MRTSFTRGDRRGRMLALGGVLRVAAELLLAVVDRAEHAGRRQQRDGEAPLELRRPQRMNRFGRLPVMVTPAEWDGLPVWSLGAEPSGPGVVRLRRASSADQAWAAPDPVQVVGILAGGAAWFHRARLQTSAALHGRAAA